MFPVPGNPVPKARESCSRCLGILFPTGWEQCCPAVFSEGDIYAEGDVERNRITVVRVLRVDPREVLAVNAQQILCTDIEAQTLHGKTAGHTRREVIAQLDGAQLQIIPVFNPIGRYTLLIVVIGE